MDKLVQIDFFYIWAVALVSISALTADERPFYLPADQINYTTPFVWKAPTFGTVMSIHNTSPFNLTLAVSGVPDAKELTPFAAHGYHDLQQRNSSANDWHPLILPAGKKTYVRINRTENGYKILGVRRIALSVQENGTLNNLPDTVYLQHAYASPQSWNITIDVLTPDWNPATTQTASSMQVGGGRDLSNFNGRTYGFRITMNDGATFKASKNASLSAEKKWATQWTDPAVAQAAQELGVPVVSANKVQTNGRILGA